MLITATHTHTHTHTHVLLKVEKATIRNKRIMKKNSPVKANIQKKKAGGNHPNTKLVGMLKDKCSKITYIHNKQLRDTQNNYLENMISNQ